MTGPNDGALEAQTAHVEVCESCGTRMPQLQTAAQVLLGPANYRRPFADLVAICPSCGHQQDRDRRYFGFVRAAHIKRALLVYVLAALAVVTYILARRL